MTAARSDNRRRAYWLKTLHEWHWVSSAICLIGMILFSVTGFTLNHAGQIEAKPAVTRLSGAVDEALRAQLEKQLPAAKAEKGKAPLPAELQAWVQKKWDIDTTGRDAEWSDDEIYLSLPRPGGDAWLRLNLADGEIEYERTDRGWLSYLTTSTRAATPALRGAGSSTSSRAPHWSSRSPACSFSRCTPATGRSPGPWWAWGWSCRCCSRCCSFID